MAEDSQSQAPGGPRLRLNVGAFELNKMGLARYDWADPYHVALNLSWPVFLAAMFALQLLINAIFGLLYLVGPGAIANAGPGLFVDALFLGLGPLTPATLYGHVVASLQLFSEVAFTAVMTGLVFGRFARPRAKILYADKAVVGVHDGAPALMLRIANGRSSLLVDATAELRALVMATTLEGDRFRRPVDLELKTPHFPMFALTWTLIHRIDEKSPLFGCTPESLVRNDTRLFVSITAREVSLSAEVHDVHSYHPADIVFGMRYAPAVSWDEAGRTVADVRLLSRIEPLAPSPPAAEEVSGRLDRGRQSV